jgi:hypothetical protein
MTGDPKACRESAKRCLEFAQTARTEADRNRFEGLAQRWLALATDFEAANLLLEKWGSDCVNLGDPSRPRPVRQTRRPSWGARISDPFAENHQSPGTVPSSSRPTT